MKDLKFKKKKLRGRKDGRIREERKEKEERKSRASETSCESERGGTPSTNDKSGKMSACSVCTG